MFFGPFGFFGVCDSFKLLILTSVLFNKQLDSVTEFGDPLKQSLMRKNKKKPMTRKEGKKGGFKTISHNLLVSHESVIREVKATSDMKILLL